MSQGGKFKKQEEAEKVIDAIIKKKNKIEEMVMDLGLSREQAEKVVQKVFAD